RRPGRRSPRSCVPERRASRVRSAAAPAPRDALPRARGRPRPAAGARSPRPPRRGTPAPPPPQAAQQPPAKPRTASAFQLPKQATRPHPLCARRSRRARAPRCGRPPLACGRPGQPCRATPRGVAQARSPDSRGRGRRSRASLTPEARPTESGAEQGAGPRSRYRADRRERRGPCIGLLHRRDRDRDRNSDERRQGDVAERRRRLKEALAYPSQPHGLTVPRRTASVVAPEAHASLHHKEYTAQVRASEIRLRLSVASQLDECHRGRPRFGIPQGTHTKCLLAADAVRELSAHPLENPTRGAVMATPGQTIVNPVSGERITFRTTAAESDGELLAIDLELAPGGRA